MKGGNLAFIDRAIRIAREYGVNSAPREQTEQLLWQKFDGNVFELRRTIIFYDEHDDEMVLNYSHPAWQDMPAFVRSLAKWRFYSTRSPDHIIRHEIGHALHYRRLADADRVEIWYKELGEAEEITASAVSAYATDKCVEFVAEVFAGLWAGRVYPTKVRSLYRELKGP